MAMRDVIILFTLCALCYGNKYSEKMNSPDYEKLANMEKPFRMQKLNLLWEKAAKKLPAEKLKLLYTDLKFQDKAEIELKKKKAEGKDKDGKREDVVFSSFKGILEKYNLWNDFKVLQEAAMLSKYSSPEKEKSQDAYVKSIFRDKKLNKLWLKAEQQGFTEEQLQTLREEFQHHQNKIDQYYQMINQLHAKGSDDDLSNDVEHILHAEAGEKLWKKDNPHQILKEKHSELKVGYDYLNSKIIPDIKNTEFDEPQVNTLWEMAKNGSFSYQELESLKGELHHFEHRIQKLKTLATLEMERDDSNIVDEASAKRNKKIKEYTYKVEKIQKELTSRILQRHSEL